MLSGITASPLLNLLYWFPHETVLRAALSIGHLAYNVSPPSILSLAVEHLIVITYPFWSADNLTTSYTWDYNVNVVLRWSVSSRAPYRLRAALHLSSEYC